MDTLTRRAKPKNDSFKKDHWRWGRKQIEDNMHVFAKFHRLADDWRASRGEDAHMGSHMFLEVIRYQTGIAMKGSEYKISNNLGPLFARLYLYLHPDENFDTKHSKYWDSNELKWYELTLLFEEKWQSWV